MATRQLTGKRLTRRSDAGDACSPAIAVPQTEVKLSAEQLREDADRELQLVRSEEPRLRPD